MEVSIGRGNRKIRAETATNIVEQMKGLMFSEKKNILFVLDRERVFGIHSFFVFFPFDAVYIDSKKRVVEVVRGIKPFTFYVRNEKPAKYLLEVSGNSGLNAGDKMTW